MAKPFDPKAKAKRQKIIAGVLGLVLVGVLFLQAPKILGMFGGSSTTASEPAATPPPAPAAPVPATPGAPASATPAAAPTGSPSLVDSDPAPVPSDGQLVTFDRFESKDPFVPQVTDDPTGQTPAPSAPTDGAPKTEQTEQTEQPKQASGGATLAPQPTQQPVSNAVTVAVNGTRHEVSPGGSFPEDDPIFRLVSLKRGTARVGIVGGGYANGAPTITLTKGGKPVTLMNTADGTTYVLRYVG
jgi:translation initiation factor IF-2